MTEESLCEWCHRPAMNPYKTFAVKRRDRKSLSVEWSRLQKFGTIGRKDVLVCTNSIHAEVWK